MKVILVPTDFSEQAGYALDAAYQLALKSKAEIWLTHVLEYPAGDDEFVTTTRLGQPLPIDWLRKVKEEIEDHLQAIIREKQLEGVHVKYYVKVGNPYRSIIRELLTDEVDLIVMGSKGASGMKEVLLGSNAERMVRFARCPVLIIKDKADISSIRNIVFADEINADLIALATHSRRGIVHLLSGSIAEDVVNHAQRPIWTMSLKA